MFKSICRAETTVFWCDTHAAGGGVECSPVIGSSHSTGQFITTPSALAGQLVCLRGAYARDKWPLNAICVLPQREREVEGIPGLWGAAASCQPLALGTCQRCHGPTLCHPSPLCVGVCVCVCVSVSVSQSQGVHDCFPWLVSPTTGSVCSFFCVVHSAVCLLVGSVVLSWNVFIALYGSGLYAWALGLTPLTHSIKGLACGKADGTGITGLF